MVKNGDKVADLITGFEGIAISRTEYLNGCVRVSVQSTQLKDGKPIEPVYFDEPQLVVLDRGAHATPEASMTGGPGDFPPTRSVPPTR